MRYTVHQSARFQLKLAIISYESLQLKQTIVTHCIAAVSVHEGQQLHSFFYILRYGTRLCRHVRIRARTGSAHCRCHRIAHGGVVSVGFPLLRRIVPYTAQDDAQAEHAYEYTIEEDAPRRQQYQGVQLLRS